MFEDERDLLERRRCVSCDRPTANQVAGVPMHTWCQPGAERRAVRASDPVTSRTAARANKEHRGRLRHLVLECHEQHTGGLTDDELSQMHPNELLSSLSKRRGELVDEGLLEDSGERRPTRRGVPAAVWRLKR